MVVFIPLLLLFVIALVPKIPLIGGDIRAALIVAGLAAALIGGLSPLGYLTATIDGVDRLAWVIMLSVFGSIYAESQVRLGAMNTTLSLLRRIFGNSPKGLIAATFVTLVLAGSLLGDAIAAATVIGFLVIHALSELKIKPVQIGMIILLGASLGSIMPPISQGVFLSASIVGVDPTPVINWAYLTVSLGVIFAIVESFRFVRGRKLPADLITKESLGELIATRWKTLVPLFVLITIVLLNTGLKFNIFAELPGLRTLTAWMLEIPVLRGLAFPVVLAIIVAIIVSFCFPSVSRHSLSTLGGGLRKVSQTVQIQLAAAFMIGMFYASGAIQTVETYAASLDGNAVKGAGAVGIVIVGMLTGSQTAAQSVLVPFLSPILENMGVDPVNIALGASHIAAAGQNMPPVGLTAFVVCGLVGAALNTKVDPVRVMVLALPNSLYFLGIGVLVWFI